MSFRLVPKSVTLNDLEPRNGRYFALFQRICVPSGRTVYKFTFAISSPDEFLFSVPDACIMHLCRRNTSRIDINYMRVDINTAYVNFVCKTERVYVHLFKALNSLICADVPLRKYSLTHYVHLLSLHGMREHIVVVLVAWSSGSTSVLGRRAFAVLRSACS